MNTRPACGGATLVKSRMRELCSVLATGEIFVLMRTFIMQISTIFVLSHAKRNVVISSWMDKHQRKTALPM